MADIARRRAALFATYTDTCQGGREAEGVHAGGTSARSLGPWSSAVQLANAQEAERAKREKAITSGFAARQAGASRWTPSRRNISLGPHHACEVPTLVDICLNLTVELLEDVETLWGVPDLVKARLAAGACRKRALCAQVLRLFTEHAPTEVYLPDCSNLTEDVLLDAVREAATPRLEKLHLEQCGRGMTDATAVALASTGPLPSLKVLRLSGAYRLTDHGLQGLLGCASHESLVELALARCSRVQGPAVEALPALATGLKVLDLTEVGGLSQQTLVNVFNGLSMLESVTLDGIPEAGDAVLCALATGPSQELKDVSLRGCHAVTDDGLIALARARPNLRSLALDENCSIGAQGLLQVASSCVQLENLSLRRCSAVHDDVVRKFAALGTLRHVSLNGCSKLTCGAVEAMGQHCSRTLESLDISWCRGIDGPALGVLADACSQLKDLALWGCSQVDETFLYGHSNAGLKIVGRGERLLPVV
jgi:hypothetical protein